MIKYMQFTDGFKVWADEPVDNVKEGELRIVDTAILNMLPEMQHMHFRCPEYTIIMVADKPKVFDLQVFYHLVNLFDPIEKELIIKGES